MKQEYWERDFSTDQRKSLAKSGDAMEDGSYPIATVQDLKNAIQASGRAKNAAAVKAHIKTRAKALGQTALIPDTWESERVIITTGEPFQESAYDVSKGQLSLTVIQPGLSKNNRYYSPELLKKSVKIFEGAKMFSDHQTDAEAKHRPEGSVKSWVASLSKAWVDEADGSIKATAVVIDPAFKAKLEALNQNKLLPQMGVSIRAIGEASDGEHNGKKAKIVESLIAARSVDFVTFAGAGGRVEAIESAGDENDVDLIDESQLRARRPDLIELIESRKETNTMHVQEVFSPPMTAGDHADKAAQFQSKADELKAGDKKKAFQDAADAHGKASEAATDAAKKSALAGLQDESARNGDDMVNAELLKENKEWKEKFAAQESATKKANAQIELTKLLAEAKLPEVAANRIKKHFETAEATDGMKEMIAAEQDYVKSLAGTVKKHNGAGDNAGDQSESDGTKARATLVESFMKNFGVSKEHAEIMAE